jgi:EAL domain-containing protein (putative c-di-GMP-specific phosphodiesterase class I)
MTAMPTFMDRILAPGALTVLFQPIVERDGGGFKLSAVESLVRGPKGTNLEPAEILFDYVRRKREEIRMDRACVAAVCEAARALPPELDISINVHSATIARDPGLVGFLVDEARARGIGPERLTVEIVEHASHWVGPGLTAGLSALRQAGLRVALDDIGLGQSNFKMIVDCRPDSFKLDAYFVRGVHADPYRQAVLQSVVVLAERVGARVVAEGVEERADLDAAVALGVSRFQGFLFSRGVAGAEIAGRAERNDWLEGPAAAA